MNSELSRLESFQSTPVSIGAMSSAFSDIESVVSLSDHKRSDDETTTENPKPASVHPEFAFADGNIEIQTTDQSFWVHEYHLKKFSVFATLIQAAKTSETVSDSGRRIILACDKKTKGEDMYNTLKVIYASHIEGIPDFDSGIMTSTLRIASAFDYPALRKFAISKLEEIGLPAIQRIQLSDEFTLPSFETPAFTELCSRTEPISQAEAEVLGMTRFVEVARIREVERTRWAAKVIEGINKDVLQVPACSLEPEGSVSAESTQEYDLDYSSGRLVLPGCDCRVSTIGKSRTVHRCKIHQAAPRVLIEGQALLRQRNELLEQLANIRFAVNCSSGLKDFPSSSEVQGIKTELSRASWIRRTPEVA